MDFSQHASKSALHDVQSSRHKDGFCAEMSDHEFQSEDVAYNSELNAGDRPQEECGVFGIYAPGVDVARRTYFGIFALQHRGQESAGIGVSDGKDIDVHKAMGLVSQVFDSED